MLSTDPETPSPRGSGASRRSAAARLDVVLVYKKSQYRLARENRNARIQGLVDVDDVSVRPLLLAHEAHEASLIAVEKALKGARCKITRLYRGRLKPEHCQGRLLVAVGGDGTLLDASHKVADGVAVGVNSDTARSTGFLCAADAAGFPALLDDILSRKLVATPVRRLAGSVDGKPLPFPVLNDLLISHKNPAQTSRYLVDHGGVIEDHKSSGVWVSTATGSTAAVASAGGVIQDLDDPRLQWHVREPFVADGPLWRHANFFFDKDGADEVIVTSKMREGRVWLDGPHICVPLPMGSRLTLHGRCAPLRLFATPEMAARRREARKQAEARAAAFVP